jgi:hypothetical protein
MPSVEGDMAMSTCLHVKVLCPPTATQSHSEEVPWSPHCTEEGTEVQMAYWVLQSTQQKW